MLQPSAPLQLPCALTIAGSDSGGGAGIQADLKTFSAHGVYGLTVLTLITAQSTQGVDAVHPLPPSLITQQLDTIFADFNIRALKTGAMGNAEIVDTVAGFLSARSVENVVVDPVLISKHGHALIAPDAIEVMKKTLLPVARVVTPNLSEAAALTGLAKIEDYQDMVEAAKHIADLGCEAVVVKGGHLTGQPADLLLHKGEEHWFKTDRVDSPHTHGTGCTFSAAIAANLVYGLELIEAVSSAKDYITGAIRYGQRFGQGINPVNHFWRQHPNFGQV